MSVKKLVVWFIGILMSLLIILMGGFFWYKNQLINGSGANTAIVDLRPFVNTYKIVGIKNVNILSPDASHFIPKRNIILKNGQIHKLSDSTVLDSTITYIDGEGKYLTPGFTDTHAHLRNSKNDLGLFLANGITSIWEMSGSQNHLDWKNEQLNGGIGPNMFVATRKLSSREGLYHWGSQFFGGHMNFTTPSDVVTGIREFKQNGYDAIKLGSFINQSIYTEIINEAKKKEIPVVGHLSQDVGLDYMYEVNPSELAHVEEIIKNLMHEFGGVSLSNTSDFLAYLKENADSTAIKIKQRNIPVSTTIFLMETLPKQMFDVNNYLKTIELEYVNPPFVEGTRFQKGWLPGNNHYEKVSLLNHPNRGEYENWWDTYVKSIQIMTKALARHEVSLLAGTDTNATGIVPGFSLHNEFESLSEVGLSNSEVLYSTTVAPALWRNLNEGQIKEGFKANLVLLDDNPLDDIRNMRSIRSVFFDSKYLDKEGIDQSLDAIHMANEKARKIDIDEFVN